MKVLFKILLTIVICTSLPLSIYYGLRLKNTPFTFEYINRSYVVTLPNKVWFEIDGGKDTLDDEQIFENDTTEMEKQGFDFGPKYYTYTITTKNDIAKRTRIANRVGDEIKIEQNIEIYKEDSQTYTTYIYFSQYGEFNKDTYTQEGCNVKITSQNGEISYDEEFAIVNIVYNAENNIIKDNISFDIQCE